MAILIDPPAWPAHGTLWSHLVSDSDYEELHAFAAHLGIPRRGFDLDHYDVPASRYAHATALGARPVTAKEIVHRLRDAGLRVRQVERETVAPVRRRQYLTGEWSALGARLGAREGRRADEAWALLGQDLLARWNEPHRRYHDERHLEDVLLSLDQLAVRGERLVPVTLLAAWFHDAVYTGGASDELDSARLAVDALRSFGPGRADRSGGVGAGGSASGTGLGSGLSSGLAERVAELIVATAPARPVVDPDPALGHLLDADLAIFAASPQRYAQYATAVRAEYAHVSAADFAAGRAGILRAYLERPAIYRSTAARDLWEQRARRNVEDELARLRLAAPADPAAPGPSSSHLAPSPSRNPSQAAAHTRK